MSRIGYTGHEAIGGISMGLNHMNGRVQDAITGRFLSADPYVTEPGNTQGYNRYSYVNNNPLSFRDPSGFGRCPGYDTNETPFECFVDPPSPLDHPLPPSGPERLPPGVDPRGPPGDSMPGDPDPSVLQDSSPGPTEEPQTQNQDSCKAAANAPKGLAATNRAFRNNSDPNKRFTVDASQLTVRQTTTFNSNGLAIGVVQGGDWFVHGTVTLQNSGGSISIRPEQYNFEQHNVTSVGEFFRNIETYGGYYVATFGGLSEYWADLTGGNHATDLNFDFTCQPTVVR